MPIWQPGTRLQCNHKRYDGALPEGGAGLPDGTRNLEGPKTGAKYETIIYNATLLTNKATV